MKKNWILFLIILSSVCFATIAEARQGCGYGRHRCYRLAPRLGYAPCVRNGICEQRWYHGPRYMPFTGRYIP